MKKLLLALILIPALLFSQSKKERKALEAQQKADQVVINNLKNHIQSLTASKSSDLSEVDYISNQFKALGLQAKGTSGFVQPFTVDDGKRIEPATYLKVNDNLLEVNKEYFPLPYSAEKKVKGTPAMALRERGVPWFIDVKDWVDAGSKTSAAIDDIIKKETAKVATKGATALFLYNSGSTADGIVFNNKDQSPTLPIPVIYITPDGYKKYFTDHSQGLDIEMNVVFAQNKINGSNVIGYADNAAPSTIVIAAHYNHAVKNEEPVKTARAGADDNGSGTAMLIELARMLTASKAKANNYLFVALGGSDRGAVAANYWLENTTVNAPLNYMINLDMVGNYSDEKKLFVEGYNSSPIWNMVFPSVSDKKLAVSIDSASVIADPYASFYKKGIPVLSFSAATHSEYANKPDEEGKINYAGELQIANLITRVIELTDPKGKIDFARIDPPTTPAAKASTQVETKSAGTTETIFAASKTTVSLGVIPDKANDEDGLKIIGVTPKKLASRLGLQPGDVLTNLGSYKISDFKSYVQALTNFKIGDKTTLRIKRGKDDKEFAVEF